MAPKGLVLTVLLAGCATTLPTHLTYIPKTKTASRIAPVLLAHSDICPRETYFRETSPDLITTFAGCVLGKSLQLTYSRTDHTSHLGVEVDFVCVMDIEEEQIRSFDGILRQEVYQYITPLADEEIELPKMWEARTYEKYSAESLCRDVLRKFTQRLYEQGKKESE